MTASKYLNDRWPLVDAFCTLDSRMRGNDIELRFDLIGGFLRLFRKPIMLRRAQQWAP